MLVIFSLQGVNNEFEVVLENYNDIFEVTPTIGRGSLRVNVRVRDPSKIDYDRGTRRYDLRVSWSFN